MVVIVVRRLEYNPSFNGTTVRASLQNLRLKLPLQRCDRDGLLSVLLWLTRPPVLAENR